ncbi:diacylglycerol kinase family protein [Paraflavitalea speifideaquila]|uniref:diacylglycerol kinase family protein n=1 Tax=Paraflavitalea speifideaquila TaxID=3076558 RepID=UPI0028EF1A10|nr:diacylglycerol kinase family protein [Paraflavitalea speifideiaquila]
MKPARFSLRARARSFQYAWQGIITFLQREHNAWLHLIATIGVMVLAWITGITKTELLALVLVIGFVWVAEMFNTCIERMMDFISRGKHPDIKFIKDLAAGAVLVAALTALITGAIIFIPKFL